jgi:hypothetical protein
VVDLTAVIPGTVKKLQYHRNQAIVVTNVVTPTTEKRTIALLLVKNAKPAMQLGTSAENAEIIPNQLVKRSWVALLDECRQAKNWLKC